MPAKAPGPGEVSGLEERRAQSIQKPKARAFLHSLRRTSRYSPPDFFFFFKVPVTFLRRNAHSIS